MTKEQIQQQYQSVAAAMGDCVFRLQTLDAQVKEIRARMDELSKQKAALESAASKLTEQKEAPSEQVEAAKSV